MKLKSDYYNSNLYEADSYLVIINLFSFISLHSILFSLFRMFWRKEKEVEKID